MEKYGNIIIYKDVNGKDNIEVKLEDNTVWLNQDELVKLYNSSKSNISEHIKHILDEKELEENSTVRKFRTVATNGKTYDIKYYNLDMIVAVGFRVHSNIGTNFRRWANDKLTEYITKGFTMNDELLKRTGGGKYFDELLARIRDIRASEKVFWRNYSTYMLLALTMIRNQKPLKSFLRQFKIKCIGQHMDILRLKLFMKEPILRKNLWV